MGLSTAQLRYLLLNSTAIFAAVALGLVLQSCAPGSLTPVTSSGSAGISAAPEPSNCNPVGPVSNPISITGSGIYYYRPTVPTIGLSGDPVSAPIRWAEVAIYNNAGSIVQCGNTDNSGNFSLQITKTPGTYTVYIYSRSPAVSTEVNASVLQDLYASQPYSITLPFTVTSGSAAVAVGTLSAKARVSEVATIPGGAFFIFDNILNVNQRLKVLIPNANFVAPKVQVYWKAGFNPYSYFGASALASFYVNGDRKLYILGGNNGDVKNTDTDHFDASVIVHEYGHFLEDVYGKSESPGGSHNGNSIIDPRLAWSEGWANYLQGQILNGRYFAGNLYVDTIGFLNDSVEGGTSGGIGVKFDLGEDGGTAAYDPVSVNGEGTFREVSISRTLFKTTRSPASNNPGSKAAAVPFAAIWNSFTSAVSGFGTTSSTIFRSIGYFNEFLNSYISTNYPGSLAAWTTNVLSDEKQNTSRVDFADPVTPTATPTTCGGKYPRAITPVVEAYDPYGTSHSNLLRSNDFYTFYYSGSGSQQINLTYTQSGVQTIDLDLELWRTNYRYIDDDERYGLGQDASSYIAVESRRLNPAIESGQESVSLSGLNAGYYLINVKAVTYNRNTVTPKTSAQLNGTANYTLQLVTNGTTTENLCPTH
jgi:hypothetical protein